MVLEITNRDYSVYLLSNVLEDSETNFYPETLFLGHKRHEDRIDTIINQTLSSELTLSPTSTGTFKFSDIKSLTILEKIPQLEDILFTFKDGWFRIDGTLGLIINNTNHGIEHALFISFLPISGDCENGFIIHDKCVMTKLPKMIDVLVHQEFCVLGESEVLLESFNKLINK